MAKETSSAVGGDDFTVLERSLAAELKCSGAEMQKFRSALLTEGGHWILRKKRVWLTPLAADDIRAHVAQARSQAVSATEPPPTVEKAPPVPVQAQRGLKKPPLTTLVVHTTNLPNRRFLLAHAPGVTDPRKGQLKRVAVRDATVFARGQDLPVRHKAGDCFELDGPEPKWRGQRVKRFVTPNAKLRDAGESGVEQH